MRSETLLSDRSVIGDRNSLPCMVTICAKTVCTELNVANRPERPPNLSPTQGIRPLLWVGQQGADRGALGIDPLHSASGRGRNVSLQGA